MAPNADVLASPVDHIQRVRALAPVFEAAHAHQEATGELDPRLVSRMHAAGLFRMLLPTWLDGAALDPLTYTGIVEEIARHDASAAWCVNQGSGCSMVAGYLDQAVARQIFGRPEDVLAWGPAPVSNAVPTADGYILNYKASFASGSRHATWLGANCVIYESDGKPRQRADGRTDLRSFIFPKSDVAISKDWNTVGLRGTGSDSYLAKDLFVPAGHVVIRDDEATRRDPSPHYRYSSTMIYSSGFGHVALGIARGFMEDFMELAMHKTPREGRSSLRNSAAVQSEVAQCRAKWNAARLYLRQCIEEAWNTALKSGRPSPEQRVAIRLAATFAIHSAKDVVDMLYDAAGSHAILRSSPFEQRFRDIHAVTQQLQGRKAHYESVGRFMFDLPLDLQSAQI